MIEILPALDVCVFTWCLCYLVESIQAYFGYKRAHKDYARIRPKLEWTLKELEKLEGKLKEV